MKVELEKHEYLFLQGYLSIVTKVENENEVYAHWMILEGAVLEELFEGKFQKVMNAKSKKVKLKNSEVIALESSLKYCSITNDLAHITRNGILDKLNRIKKY